MRAFWIVLIGIAAAVLYGTVSQLVVGSWNASLAFCLGVVVALPFSGFRLRLAGRDGDALFSGRSRERTGARSTTGEAGRTTGEAGRNPSDAMEPPSAAGATPVPSRPDAGQSRVGSVKEIYVYRPSSPRFIASFPASTDATLRAASDGASSPSAVGGETPSPAVGGAMASTAVGGASSSPAVGGATPYAAEPEMQPPDAEELWERACAMSRSDILDPQQEAECMNLIHAAAELGHVSALAKLGRRAFRGGAFVEAYFWTKLAHRRLELEDSDDGGRIRELDSMLLSIRREWTVSGQPMEFENVHGSFPEERGELGRAFLRLDAGIESWKTREYIRHLAEKGNPDAALFVGG